MEQILVTGIKPTGTAHIGNYFGAILPALELANKYEKTYYFIADYHALNSIGSAEEMKKYSRELTAMWLACGLDPNKTIFYRQSDVPEVFELNWILSNITPKGLMNRAHAYKAFVEKNKEEGLDFDSGVNMGLFNYPILMAADILLFNSTLVPVGLDQKQHVEITKEIARYFNNKYGETFIVPKEVIKEETKTVLGIDGRKMSKSYNNVIGIFETEQNLKKKIFSVVTDSSLPTDPKPTNHMLMDFYKLFASEAEIKELENRFSQGIGWGEVKKIVFEKANEMLTPLRERYEKLYADEEYLEKVLKEGAEKARAVAKQTIAKVRKAIGVK